MAFPSRHDLLSQTEDGGRRAPVPTQRGRPNAVGVIYDMYYAFGYSVATAQRLSVWYDTPLDIVKALGVLVGVVDRSARGAFTARIETTIRARARVVNEVAAAATARIRDRAARRIQRWITPWIWSPARPGVHFFLSRYAAATQGRVGGGYRPWLTWERAFDIEVAAIVRRLEGIVNAA